MRATRARSKQRLPAHLKQHGWSRHRTPLPDGGGVSHVYTVRTPAELRAVAEQAGEHPSALMRRWVLERLDDERGHQPDLADVRRGLTDALHTLDQIRRRPA